MATSSPPSQPLPATERFQQLSSQSLLTRSLELARQAVHLDAADDDPHSTILFYGQSTALLKEVVDRDLRNANLTEHEAEFRVTRALKLISAW
ncbi:hypothetical protein EIP91_008997 [Steccherinum ochraceum]|uniref:Uncharacterized protein n=1 Tax=Steccherinum ochraceum TaxID=92696 RepID=A0A4R0R278_9APHY|nr:hypothetical protein EIP91_008997 [Steccherinum ochraceum]